MCWCGSVYVFVRGSERAKAPRERGSDHEGARRSVRLREGEHERAIQCVYLSVCTCARLSLSLSLTRFVFNASACE